MLGMVGAVEGFRRVSGESSSAGGCCASCVGEWVSPSEDVPPRKPDGRLGAESDLLRLHLMLMFKGEEIVNSS